MYGLPLGMSLAIQVTVVEKRFDVVFDKVFYYHYCICCDCQVNKILNKLLALENKELNIN